MPDVKIKIKVEPIGRRIFLNQPGNGLKAIAGAGLGINTVCGGKGTCGKCRIIILGKGKKPVNKREREILSFREITNGVRLACQQTFDRSLSIYIPSSSLSDKQKLQVTGEEKAVRIDPICRKYFIKFKQAGFKKREPDFNRIKSSMKKKYGLNISSIDCRVLAGMSSIVKKSFGEITVTARNGEIILIESKDKTGKNYGLAVDLGTTKIAILLVDLITGKTIDSRGIVNPQVVYGEDVISRINYAMESRDNAERIKEAVIDKIDEEIEKLCRKNNLESKEITEIVIVGNTAMHHLFLGLPVNQLGLSPFVSFTNKSLHIKAREHGIKIAPGGYIFLPPPIAGFVGSDHLALILSAEIYKKRGNCLGIDIGTNTEIVLKSKKEITSVSTASGPAFEGGHIEYGMRAAPGAIEKVLIDSETCMPFIQTVDDKKPIGICGSGILDSIAELLRRGIVDKNGRFTAGSDCIRRDSKGELKYILVPQDRGRKKIKAGSAHRYGSCMVPGAGDKNISISQKDIVEIQLAKGAIRAGTEILLKSAGINHKEIDSVIIAGAFGSYIDPRNVINIGMFPNIQLEKISQIGNAAVVGAKMILISKRKRVAAEKIAKEIKYLELTVFPGFSDYFINSMQFPSADEII